MRFILNTHGAITRREPRGSTARLALTRSSTLAYDATSRSESLAGRTRSVRTPRAVIRSPLPARATNCKEDAGLTDFFLWVLSALGRPSVVCSGCRLHADRNTSSSAAIHPPLARQDLGRSLTCSRCLAWSARSLLSVLGDLMTTLPTDHSFPGATSVDAICAPAISPPATRPRTPHTLDPASVVANPTSRRNPFPTTPKEAIPTPARGLEERASMRATRFLTISTALFEAHQRTALSRTLGARRRCAAVDGATHYIRAFVFTLSLPSGSPGARTHTLVARVRSLILSLSLASSQLLCILELTVEAATCRFLTRTCSPCRFLVCRRLFSDSAPTSP